jgi:hypothetical protein
MFLLTRAHFRGKGPFPKRHMITCVKTYKAAETGLITTDTRLKGK